MVRLMPFSIVITMYGQRIEENVGRGKIGGDRLAMEWNAS